MIQPTDTELKRIFLRLLPERLFMCGDMLHYKADEIQCGRFVTDSELLSLCREVEDNLRPYEIEFYDKLLVEIVLDYWKSQGKSINEFTPQMVRYACTHASWEYRIMGLGKLKGVLVL